MTQFVGIDLGTTNSAIASFDGEQLRLWKSPEQNDVTPSAIYVDRRGNRYVGKRAYDVAPSSQDSVALLFKRMMGTATPIRIAGLPEPLSAEQCSAEVLRTLYAYLPEEVRNSVQGTVITVPAAFNQMQKDASQAAADAAGIGAVALMQEPVAAVMSVMRARKTEGVFIVYDMGGGTLDVAIAESVQGRVSLLAHGGIEMCGGRDWDRLLVTNVVRPWLEQHFKLPENLAADDRFRRLTRLAEWAAEKAKIELSSREDVVISMSEAEVRMQDIAGTDIYLDVPVSRKTLDALVADKVTDSIQAVRDTMAKVQLGPNDVDRIVFVGGPTHYKTLRDRVAFELSIAGAMDVNPMTAVAEGAAVFAESVDWSSASRGRKSSRGTVAATDAVPVSFNYTARTPDSRARVVAKLSGAAMTGYEFQLDSLDTGWSSGRVSLRDGASVEVALTKQGDNAFKVFLFGANGAPIGLPNDRIVIARTAASVEAIPASHSIGIEVLERLGGTAMLDWLVQAGEALPKKGKRTFKTTEALRAGAKNALHFKLWEGEIQTPPTDNRFVGSLRISGSDFDAGVIAAGSDLICEYEILDSGRIVLDVSVPAVNASFREENFYSGSEGYIDYSNASAMIEGQASAALERVEELSSKVDDPRLDQALRKLEAAAGVSKGDPTPEEAKQAMDDVLEARRLLARVREANLAQIRQIELDGVREFFDENVREHAKPVEASQFDNNARTAQRAIEQGGHSFEVLLDELRSKNFEILWRQDWYVLQRFQWYERSPHMFPDRDRFKECIAAGSAARRADDVAKLRSVVAEMMSMRVGTSRDQDMLVGVSIVRG